MTLVQFGSSSSFELVPRFSGTGTKLQSGGLISVRIKLPIPVSVPCSNLIQALV
uniref:Uncharacterized protein n=1 Tax=Rhizophora mucronata TaxID=61149 RepID=A0A2P2P1H8_RHIMU